MTTSEILFNRQPVTREAIYSLLLNYKGYGNPAGKYWFVGMEEHWRSEDKFKPLIGCKQEDIDYYSQKIVPFENVHKKFYEDAKRKGNPFERGIIKLLQKLEGEEEYQSVLESDTFITNCRFAPFPTLKEIFQTFGKSKTEYLKDYYQYKIEISRLWLNSRPQRTFCLSKKYTEEFNSLFQNVISSFSFAEIGKLGLFFRHYKYEDLFLYQILHPRRFSGKYLEKVTELL